MTLRLKQLAKELPNNNFNISKTGKKVGYSESYANSQLCQTVRKSKVFKNYFDEETVRKELRLALKKCKSKEDHTNVLRAVELMSKILGMQLDKSEITNKNPDKIIIAYGNKQPVNNPDNTEHIDNEAVK